MTLKPWINASYGLRQYSHTLHFKNTKAWQHWHALHLPLTLCSILNPVCQKVCRLNGFPFLRQWRRLSVSSSLGCLNVCADAIGCVTTCVCVWCELKREPAGIALLFRDVISARRKKKPLGDHLLDEFLRLWNICRQLFTSIICMSVYIPVSRFAVLLIMCNSSNILTG